MGALSTLCSVPLLSTLQAQLPVFLGLQLVLPQLACVCGAGEGYTRAEVTGEH